MAALTTDRNTAQIMPGHSAGDVAAGVTLYQGALVMRDAAGDLVAGQTATGLVGVGCAVRRADNSAGAAGDLVAEYAQGVFHYANSSGADEITKANIGDVCFAVDDQTVALTNGTNTRSPAGTIHAVDSNGVWVRLDEALTAAAAA